jgi:hypothetical protein
MHLFDRCRGNLVPAPKKMPQFDTQNYLILLDLAR